MGNRRQAQTSTYQERLQIATETIALLNSQLRTQNERCEVLTSRNAKSEETIRQLTSNNVTLTRTLKIVKAAINGITFPREDERREDTHELANSTDRVHING